MADYCSSGLWDQNDHGVMISLSEHIPATPEVIALEHDIQNWNIKYDEYLLPNRNNPDFDWESFHKEGILLAQRVKKTIGPNGKVVYFKESNKNTATKSETILIQDEN